MCQKNCTFVKWFWPRQGHTHVRSRALVTCRPCCFLDNGRELPLPRHQAQVFWTLKALTDLVSFLVTPPVTQAWGGHAGRVHNHPKREKGRTKYVCIGPSVGLSSRASKLLTQAVLWLCQHHVWWGRKSGVRFGCCLSLHPKTIVRGNPVRSQVPTEPRKKPKACVKPSGRPCGEDLWWWVRWRAVFWFWNDYVLCLVFNVAVLLC